MSRLITMGVLVFILGAQTLSAQFPLDKSFGENGFLFLEQADDVIQLSNGNILVFDGSLQDNYSITVFAFDDNGKAKESFGDNGALKFQFDNIVVFRMAIAAENNEWYMWMHSVDNLGYRDSIIRFNEEGERIKEYGINGAVRVPFGDGYVAGNMLILRSGELMVAVELESLIPSLSSRYVCKYTKEGAPDPQFGDSGRAIMNHGEMLYDNRPILLEHQDGSILVGNTITTNNNSKTELELLTNLGLPDSSFGNSGKVILSAGTNTSVLSSYWYEEMSEILYILTDGPSGESFVWQLNRDGELNYAYGSNGHKQNLALIGAQTMYKINDGTFFFTGIEFLNNYFQRDIAIWKTNAELAILPWASGDLSPSINLIASPDYVEASDDYETRSLMMQDGSILILCKATFRDFYLLDTAKAALIKVPPIDQPRTDLCPLLSVPVLYHDQEQSFLQLTLDPLASGNFTFSVTDMMGRTVIPHYSLYLAPGISNYTYPIPLELPNGMYLLTIHADDCATGIKFVK